ncbi:hypothetical protein [Calothrix sp. NIES-3974]|uniref:hypothetical protein n=1 Tax=Calothrix sp. NIES-3974 TaxID=2005462 RepID=UPI000B5E8996|nr:hypothetical protein [Calothrix sp. NIES-3974]BAZ04206.1 hypothetical protein NIES3974_08380 [Calothrix sp. NIES-3974]
MAIQLHSFTSVRKRYVQVETQPYYITGVFRKIQQIINVRGCDFVDVRSAYYECPEDGTVTFYLAQDSEVDKPGIWTYLAYECPEGQEKIERDNLIDTRVTPLLNLLAGEKILQPTTCIEEFLAYAYSQGDYLEVELPYHWDTYEGRRIAEQLLIEFTALRKSIVFASGAGKKYAKDIISRFIELAVDVLENDDSFWDFDAAQYNVLQQIDSTPIARQIMEFNDYLIWQDALPTKSKAVDYAFQSALNMITHVK